MRSSRFLMISAMGLLLGAGSALAQGRPATTYRTIDPPGATSATAWGIDPQGNIVGQFTDSIGTHGFLRRAAGDYQTIDYPDVAAGLATGTDARGISPTGEIVGNFWGVPGDAAYQIGIHGYLLTTDGVFTPLDEHGHLHSIAQRILPDGMILGCIHDGNMGSTMKGMIVGNGVYEERNANSSMDNGATPDLEMIVGWYNPGIPSGYSVVDGVFTSFTIPNSNFTQAWDVNPQGEIVGIYKLNGAPATAFRGFVLKGNAFTAIDFPEASQTKVYSINPLGNVVGLYVDSLGKTHAFLATR